MQNHKLQVSTSIPETGFLRLHQIIGRRAVTEEEAEQNRRDAKAAKRAGQKPNKKPKLAKQGVPPIIPISKSNWWDGVKSGRYPKPVKTLGLRITAWHVNDIRELIDKLQNGGGHE